MAPWSEYWGPPRSPASCSAFIIEATDSQPNIWSHYQVAQLILAYLQCKCDGETCCHFYTILLLKAFHFWGDGSVGGGGKTPPAWIFLKRKVCLTLSHADKLWSSNQTATSQPWSGAEIFRQPQISGSTYPSTTRPPLRTASRHDNRVVTSRTSLTELGFGGHGECSA